MRVTGGACVARCAAPRVVAGGGRRHPRATRRRRGANESTHAHRSHDPRAESSFLERGGYHVRLAVTGRVDGRPLVDYDRRTIPALIRLALAPPSEGLPARDAFVRTLDGGVAWSPEARKVLDAMKISGAKSKKAAKGKAVKKPAQKRKAAKKPTRTARSK